MSTRPDHAIVPALRIIAKGEVKRRDAGMATAEYAIATLAACGFAALLVIILRSDGVRDALMGVINKALALGDG
jgi:hypothetical protein